jgi:cytochrome P450
MEKALSINFDTPEIIANPFPVYEQIRAAGRMVRNELLGTWMVTGYQDVVSLFTNPNVFSNSIYAMPGGPDVLRGNSMMMDSDPPEHGPLRKVAYNAFRRSSVAKLEKTITEVVDGLLDDPALHEELAGGHEVDMMTAFCRQVPGTVIALLLGIPVADVPTFIAWSDDLTKVMDSGQHSTPEYAATVAAAERSGTAMWEYLQAQVDRHRQLEQDDLINDLLVANEGGILNDGQLLATCILLLIAGNETTTKLMGTGLRLLADHPDQRRDLAGDPSLTPGAVDEILRYQGVAAILPRAAKVDTTFADADVKAGDVILALNIAANRDPAAFPDPNKFDIRRTPNRHLAFGHGIHHCLGNQLARMEARIAFDGFLRRHPDYQVNSFRYAPVFLARGLDSLVITAG